MENVCVTALLSCTVTLNSTKKWLQPFGLANVYMKTGFITKRVAEDAVKLMVKHNLYSLVWELKPFRWRPQVYFWVV